MLADTGALPALDLLAVPEYGFVGPPGERLVSANIKVL